MTQWHPVFAKLLRPLLDGYFDVRTGVAVGEAPRAADLVLVRRTASRAMPFRGLWKDLTAWNVLEFKGPTVSPRRGDLDLLVELGLGIHRRLNEDRAERGRRLLEADAVSFWYLANHLGRRFLRFAEEELGTLEPWGMGVWRCQVLRRLVFLVSGANRPVERDSLPLHVLARETPEAELAVARLVGADPSLWETYGEWVLGFHPAAVEELHAMARAKTRGFKFHIEPFIQIFGLEEVLRQIGPERVIEHLGPKRFVKQMGVEGLLSCLTPTQRRELKRRLEGES